MAPPERMPIAGVRVLVTRPAGQADALCAAVEDAGGHAMRFPAMAIDQPADRDAARAGVARAGDHDLAVFISANAVRAAAALAGALHPPPAWPLCVAVGPATARELESCGFTRVLAPDARFDSEGVLALDELAPEAVAGRQVIVFKGEGGRDLLARELERRGATVREVALYRRSLPDADPAPVIAALAHGDLDAVVVTSGDALRNLIELLGPDGARRLGQSALVVVSRRVAELAGRLGVPGEPAVAGGADESSILAAIAKVGGRPRGNPAHASRDA